MTLACTRLACIFHDGQGCGCAEIAGPSGIFAELEKAVGLAPRAAVGCSRCQEVETENECTGECKL